MPTRTRPGIAETMIVGHLRRIAPLLTHDHGAGSHHRPFGRNDLDCARDRAVTEDGRLGTVAVLRRYPVKSMLGEDLRASDVTWRGLAGDRVLAVVHRGTGKVGSAKNPLLWRGLHKLAATASGPAVKITLP